MLFRSQRGLRLLSKICKAQRILPTSYILRDEVIYVGSVHDHGGFAEVSNGEYLGYPVAIKQLKMTRGDPDKIFKVPSINLAHCLLLSFRPAVMSGDHMVETLIPSKHLASGRGFYVHGPTLFPDLFSVDVQRKRDRVCNVQSRGKSAATGAPAAVSS